MCAVAPDLPPIFSLPEADAPVRRSGGQDRLVWRPRDAENSIRMTFKFGKQFTRLCVPETDRAVAVTRSQRLSVGRPRDTVSRAKLHIGRLSLGDFCRVKEIGDECAPQPRL